jgi:hypothetical protein
VLPFGAGLVAAAPPGLSGLFLVLAAAISASAAAMAWKRPAENPFSSKRMIVDFQHHFIPRELAKEPPAPGPPPVSTRTACPA